MLYFLAILGAYLIGSFPTGVVLSRRKYGLDVREMGSGNIGATNVMRVFGWYAGFLTFGIDLAKGALAVWLARYFFPESSWFIPIAGFGVVLGHCYSVFLGFRGGKGVATTLGCILVVAPWCAVIAGAVYLTLLLISRISAVGSLGSMFTALIYIPVIRPEVPAAVLVAGTSIVVLLRHRDNVQRLGRTIKQRKKS